MKRKGPAAGHESHVEIERSEIAQHAYAIWLARGQPAGRDLEFWLQAEVELQAARRGWPGKPRVGEKGRERESVRAGFRRAGVETPTDQGGSGLRRAEVKPPMGQGVLGEAGVGQRQGQAPATQAGRSSRSRAQAGDR